MVDPSGAEVTLRDLLVVENPDMMDPAGTTVGLLALREADPEEMALVPGSPTHPWSPIRIHRISLLGGGWGGFPEGFHSEDTESKDGRNYGQLPPEVNGNLPGVCVADRGASREAGLQANRTVVMMINGCSDAEVAACLRGASVRPETIEISLDYLIERDVDIDRRTDGSRSSPQTTPVAPATPTRSARNTSRTQSSSTPNGNLQELQASISRLQRDMTSLTTSNNDQFSSIQDVVAMISTDNPAGNNSVQPRIGMDPDDETKSGLKQDERYLPGVVRDSATIELRTAPGQGNDTKNGMPSQLPQTKGVLGSAWKGIQQEGGIQERPEDKLQTEATMLPLSDERHGPGAQLRPVHIPEDCTVST
ncbi:hypothetical protein DYB38_014301 [Aphanomyces astaci]|uniref:Uncharacterized protein n=1 Tax=Aphanomyces astaci TaxID=112090 RepID=A0A397E693_APHAT|nr:hypothetical protein DYB38_014301 [Aphanomyces astaci]